MKRFCIIGAGASGLAVAKSFAERGIAFDCFEALSDVGGIWNPESPHVVYGSTYLNSSKKLSRYPDFHFPEEWAHYASRAQAQDYLRAYAKEFGLYKLISFNKRVTRAEHTPQGWRVQIEGESAPRSYAGLVIANGHHWEAVVADLSRPFRRRDAALPRRQVEGAGQGQARAGGGRGQLSRRYSCPMPRSRTGASCTRCAAPTISSPRRCSASRPTCSSTTPAASRCRAN